jgi:hypothetical protein
MPFGRLGSLGKGFGRLGAPGQGGGAAAPGVSATYFFNDFFLIDFFGVDYWL